MQKQLKLCEEEGLADASIPRAYYDAFQIAIFNGDRARARVFAERASAARVVLEGDDSPTVHRIRDLALDPTRHASYDSAGRWPTSTNDVPSNLSAEEFETWLRREQKKPQRQYADFRDGVMFPAFGALPEENGIGLGFFQSNDEFLYESCRPRKHWCFLAEIVEIERFLRLKLIVKDKAGRKSHVVFHTDGRGDELALSGVREGVTVAILYPEQHGFFDMSVGIRHENPKLLRVSFFPQYYFTPR